MGTAKVNTWRRKHKMLPSNNPRASFTSLVLSLLVLAYQGSKVVTAVNNSATNTTLETNTSHSLKTLTIGYLPIDKTYSTHGYQLVERQYRVISGALTYAIDVINEKRVIPGYRVGFVWNDTHGTTLGGLQAVTDQWRLGVDMFLGPEETCNYEGRVAAAWNLPMLSFMKKNAHNIPNRHQDDGRKAGETGNKQRHEEE